MSGALPNRSTTSVSRHHRKHPSDRNKAVTSPTRPLRTPREIQPHQNWLARFLRIKPAVSILCFHTSRIRARKEITAVFREWRKYGMKDIVIDKAAGRIWGRVAVKNCKGPRLDVFVSDLILLQQPAQKLHTWISHSLCFCYFPPDRFHFT